MKRDRYRPTTANLAAQRTFKNYQETIQRTFYYFVLKLIRFR